MPLMRNKHFHVLLQFRRHRRGTESEHSKSIMVLKGRHIHFETHQPEFMPCDRVQWSAAWSHTETTMLSTYGTVTNDLPQWGYYKSAIHLNICNTLSTSRDNSDLFQLLKNSLESSLAIDVQVLQPMVWLILFSMV